MIKPEEETILDFSTSCTQEQAVMKLLGWSQGPILRKVIQLTEAGVSEDQLPFIAHSDVRLLGQLEELHEAARQNLIDAASGETADETLERLENEVKRYRRLIEKAQRYNLDLATELNELNTSDLRLDRGKTATSGEPYITLISLDSWAKKKYGISVLKRAEGEDTSQAISREEVDIAVPSKTEAKGIAKSLPKSEMEPRESGVDDDHIPNGKAMQSLQVTFAFLVEAYAAKKEGVLKGKDDKVNVLAMTDEIFGIIQNVTGKRPPHGQGKESIRKRINAALKAKKESMPIK